jgi:outer membrane immunogenic protein
MRKLFLATTALVALAGSASAADLAVKAPVYKAPEPVYSWTGFYVDFGFGYGMYNADTVLTQNTGATFLPLTQTQGGRGWLGTVSVGYDYQATGQIVIGVLADYDFASIKGTIQDQGPFTVGTMKEQWAWAAGGRIGWLINPGVLSYVSAGYTQAHFSSVDMRFNLLGLNTSFSTVGSHTYSGYFVGGGLEAMLPMFGRGWFTRAEYRFADYRSANLPNVTLGGAVSDFISIHPYVQTIRTELVYKFNSGPVVAKY